MPRLIDADALFQPDENSDKVLIIGGQRCGGKTVALAMELLKKKVEAAPTIDLAPQWIPVTERLPVQGEEVIAWAAPFASKAWRNEKGDWVTTYGPAASLKPVTHWMPLPKPPEDGGNDND